MIFRTLLLAITVLCSIQAMAVIEERTFTNADQEARYHKLTDEMRCPKCLNANLSGSDAPIAADLRAEIYDQIIKGRSDDEITSFMIERYGDFIMYRPPLNIGTALLWFGPGVLLLLGFVIARRMLSSTRQLQVSDTLSAAETQQLDAILETPKEPPQL